MRRHKRLWTKLAVALGSACLAVGFGWMTGRAAEVNTNSVNIRDSITQWKVGNAVGNSYGSNGVNYPTIESVEANNTIDGHITNLTTAIKIKMSGSVSTTNGTNMSKVYFDVFTDPTNGSFSGMSLRSSEPTQSDNLLYIWPFGVYPKSSVDTNKTQTITVDLSKKLVYPIYVGIRIFINGTDYTYRFGVINTPDLSTTVVQPTSTDKTIKGTGEAGNVVTVTIGDSITKTATVGSDGNYEIDFGKAIGNANQSVVVKQSESPDAQVYTGGQGIATTTIKAPPLTISPTTANITYNAADLKALAGKTQQEVVDWLVNKAQITAKNTDDASDQLTFMSDTSDVLKALQAGENTGSATIKVYAKNATNDETSRATVTATYDGELAFSVVAPTITFGTNELPTTAAKEFAVTNQPVLKIKDTRATGSKWALMARTDGLKDGTTSLNGQLLYRDAQGNQVPLTASNTKLTGGQKVAGQTETPVDLDSSATGDKAGIFLQVQAGNKIGAYSGTINWTLTDAP